MKNTQVLIVVAVLCFAAWITFKTEKFSYPNYDYRLMSSLPYSTPPLALPSFEIRPLPHVNSRTIQQTYNPNVYSEFGVIKFE